MKHNGGEANSVSKKRKANTQMKTTVQADNKLRNTVMKVTQTNRKKKESKTLNIEAAARDTIAETIAFVIKGQLTPIKPTPLPVSKPTKHVIKRLQKARCCKIEPNKPQKPNTKVPIKTAKIPTKSGPTRSTLNEDSKLKTPKAPIKATTIPNKNNQSLGQTNRQAKTKKDLDSSIKKIIKKYTKKLNIKSEKQEKGQPKSEESKSKKVENCNKQITGRISKVAKIPDPKLRIRKQSVAAVVTNSVLKPRKKYVKRKDKSMDKEIDSNTQSKSTREKKNDEENSEAMQIKIKEEKVENDFPAVFPVQSDISNDNKKSCEKNTITEIKKEPIITDSNQDQSTKDISKPKGKVVKSNDKSNKKKSNAKKLRMLKKKSLISKKAQQLLEDKRRAKLLQFWNSPKRHRVASLNAIAKVHCLYENESKAAFDKMAENAIIKNEPNFAEGSGKKKVDSGKERTTSSHRFLVSESDDDSEEELPVKRILRDVPGLRAIGKHWDMHDSISSDNNSDIEVRSIPKKVVRVKKEVSHKKPEKKDKLQKIETEKQKRKRKPKEEVYMDLKDMVVKKRMASLNASAMLAASYSSEKKMKPISRTTDSSSYDSDSSAEEYFAAVEQIDLTKDAKEDIKQEEDRNLIEVHTTPNKKVAVILNQDTDVTITGVYVNSTTRSTHHEGYCSIAGMQYRISATSHTQTAATAVATETLLQSSSSSENAHSDAQSCSSKSYTPLDALSNMQPPPGPGIHNAPQGHHGMPCQPIPQMGSPQHRQHPSTSAFSSPHGPPVYPAPPQGGPPPPGDSPVGFAHGYYQPAGPLISVSHGHGQPPPTQQPPLPKSVPLSDASPTSVSSSVHQAPPPPAPSSNNGDSSDNEVIITSVTSGNKDPPSSSSHQPNASYRYPQYSQYHTYPCPPQYHYQTPPPPTPPYPHHEMCYPATPPAGYMRSTKYAPAPSATYHRYPYYPGHGSEMYPSTSAPPAQPSQQIVTATPVPASGSYPSASNVPLPPPAIMEPYPPPPAPPTLVDPYQPTAPYYPSPYGLPPTCYSHSPTRAISYINAYQHCPCPLNTCPKNGHTGPLTGESKRSNISKDSKPLPPVALALPLEPGCATGPPSPARGSAGMPSGGMPPPPSPAGANYQPPTIPTPKQESRSPEASECKVEKRKARVGKANVRNNMQSTMLLMCNPTQDYVKREIESPKDKEELHKKEERQVEDEAATKGDSNIPEACTMTTCTIENCDLLDRDLRNGTEGMDESVPVQTTQMDCGLEESMEMTVRTEPDNPPPKEYDSPPPKEEPLPPCIATVAENVKVKNMKRKQSQSKEKVPEKVVPPPAKKKKLSSYKDFIRKHASCFKISNGKKKLVSKASRTQLPKIKLKSPSKTKLNVSKEQTNNRRIKANKLPLKDNMPAQTQNLKKPTVTSVSEKKDLTKKKNISKQHASAKTAPKILDNLIAKNNIDKVIDDVINNSMRTDSDVQVKEAVKDVEVKKPALKPSKQMKIANMKSSANRRKSTSKCKIEIPETDLKIVKKSTTLPKWSNGWMWDGESYEGKVFINSDETLVRTCYPSMKHKEGDLIRPGDCVLLKAGPRKNDLPFVAKIAALWENSEDGEMMMSLLWYYRPEHTEQGRLLTDQPDEVFASRHKDSNSVACIDDKCYVLTYNEYCRYKKNFKRIEEGVEERPRCVPLPDPYLRKYKQPPTNNISPEMVFFCRKVYDFRQKRIIKNPT